MAGWRHKLYLRSLNMVSKYIWAPGRDVKKIRKRTALLDGRAGRYGDKFQVEEIVLSGVLTRKITVEGSREDQVLLYFHGGGFTIDLPQGYARFAAHLAKRLGVTVLLPDYSLSPEHPFPAGPADCLATYKAVLKQGIEPHKLLVAGDSAGGNLTLVTLLQAKEQGLPMPAAAWALSPGVDIEVFAKLKVTPDLMEDPFVSNLETVQYLINCYISGHDPLDYRLSPIEGDLSGLPPLLIEAGEREVLTQGVRDFTAKARQSGSFVTKKIWPDMPHVFQIMSVFEEARIATDEACAFLADYLGQQPETLSEVSNGTL